jgi:hypothetical protein
MTGMALSAGNRQPCYKCRERAPVGPFFAENAAHNNPFTIFFCATLTLPPDILAQNLRI